MAIEAGERPKLLRLGKCELWRGGIAGLVSDGYVVYFGAAVRGILFWALSSFFMCMDVAVRTRFAGASKNINGRNLLNIARDEQMGSDSASATPSL